MKIEIDTRKDSAEDMRRAVRLLQDVLGDEKQETKPDLFGSSEEAGDNVLGGLFAASAEPESTPEPDSEDDESSAELIPY